MQTTYRIEVLTNDGWQTAPFMDNVRPELVVNRLIILRRSTLQTYRAVNNQTGKVD